MNPAFVTITVGGVIFQAYRAGAAGGHVRIVDNPRGVETVVGILVPSNVEMLIEWLGSVLRAVAGKSSAEPVRTLPVSEVIRILDEYEDDAEKTADESPPDETVLFNVHATAARRIRALLCVAAGVEDPRDASDDDGDEP